MENSNGVAVLRIAFDGDDEREAERSTPPPATEILKHPTTGARVDVVGTAHVSAQSARETRAVIMAARPDVVMVELDPARLNALVRDSQRRFPARAIARNVATHSDALRVIWNGRALNTMGGLGYAAVGAVLGSQPGAEFLAAIDAAKEVGAEVVLGDLDADVTAARVFARLRWRREIRARDRRLRRERGEDGIETETETETDDETRTGTDGADADDDDFARLAATRERATIRYPDGAERAAPAPLPAEALRLMRKAGCDDVAVERAVWELVLLPETDSNATAHLVVARECGNKVVELLRSRDFLAGAGFRSSRRRRRGPDRDRDRDRDRGEAFDGGWAVEETLKRDRDLVLAHSLQRPLAARRIVGVMGAGHVDGVRRLWDGVPTRESRDAYDAALSRTPAEVEAARRDTVWGSDWAYYAGGAASGLLVGFAARGMRGSAARIVSPGAAESAARSAASFASRAAGLAFGVAATAGAVGTALTANALVTMGRLAEKLERIARAAEEEGLAAPRRNELRSSRWRGARGADADGEPTLEVRAVNAVGAYKNQDDTLYR
jgi:hypothetical protein